MAWRNNRYGRSLPLVVLLSGVTALAACSTFTAPTQPPAHPAAVAPSATTAGGGGVAPRTGTGTGGSSGGGSSSSSSSSSTSTSTGTGTGRDGKAVLPVPATLRPFPGVRAYAGAGVWQPAGRLVGGKPALYETLIVPPGDSKRAGIAWMDTKLLSARLYSGSMSPGGGPYKYTAPVTRTAASSLVAAFNGGFKMADAHGGYYTEGRLIKPLVRGSASLVIYADGSITVGAWGSDVTMTPSVVAVRQNLFPLVAGGKPTALAATPRWRTWGGTCPCGAGQQGSEYQWRSGLGVTADGALVYVVGPVLSPLMLADVLMRAGAVRGMQLDINPTWPVFASFKPAAPDGLAAPSNGSGLVDTSRGAATFFDRTYARDFVTMSARPASGSR
jgi:hypothetical protein